MAATKRRSRKLSEATKRARRLHRAGVKRLNELFAYDPKHEHERTGQGGDGRPLKHRSTGARCSPTLYARRRRRKIAHESRRRNR